MVESGGKSDEAVSGRIDHPAAAPAPNGLVVADTAGEAGTGGDGGVEAERGIGLPIAVVPPALGDAVVAQAACMRRADRDRTEGALRRNLPAVSAPALRGSVVPQSARCRTPAHRDGGESALGGRRRGGTSHDIAPALKGADVAYSARLARAHGDGSESARWGVNPDFVVVAPAIGGAVVAYPTRIARPGGYGSEVSAEVNSPAGIVLAALPALNGAVFADAARMISTGGHGGEASSRSVGFLNGAGRQQDRDHRKGQRQMTSCDSSE